MARGLAAGVVFAKLKIMKTLKVAALLAFAHFAATIFLFYASTSPPPDYDFVVMYPGIRLISEQPDFASAFFLSPLLFIEHTWGDDYFYGGWLWWFAALLISCLCGVALSAVWLKVTRQSWH